jgi:hypothetical protein
VYNIIIPSYVFPSAIEITSIIMALFKGAEIVSNILLLKGVFDVSIINSRNNNKFRNSSGRSEQDTSSGITGLLNTNTLPQSLHPPVARLIGERILTESSALESDSLACCEGRHILTLQHSNESSEAEGMPLILLVFQTRF